MDSASRRFGLSDALILIGAIAATIALGRYYWGTPISFAISLSDGQVQNKPSYMPLRVRGLELTLSLTLAAFSPALLMISLKRPRAPFRTLVRQPGFWACLVGTVASSVYLLRQVAESKWKRGGDLFPVPFVRDPGEAVSTYYFDMFPFNAFPGLRVSVGFWMVCALVPLVVFGRWRGRPGWVEISGRCLGLLWILLYLDTWRLPPW